MSEAAHKIWLELATTADQPCDSTCGLAPIRHKARVGRVQEDKTVALGLGTR
jgi:hypothetical protein